MGKGTLPGASTAQHDKFWPHQRGFQSTGEAAGTCGNAPRAGREFETRRQGFATKRLAFVGWTFQGR